ANTSRRVPWRRAAPKTLREPSTLISASAWGASTERRTLTWAAWWQTTSGRSSAKMPSSAASRMSTRYTRARGAMLSAEPDERSSTTATSWPAARKASVTLEPMKPAPPVIRMRMRTLPWSGAAGPCSQEPARRGREQRPFARAERAGGHRGHQERGGARGSRQDQAWKLVRVAGNHARHREEQRGGDADARDVADRDARAGQARHADGRPPRGHQLRRAVAAPVQRRQRGQQGAHRDLRDHHHPRGETEGEAIEGDLLGRREQPQEEDLRAVAHERLEDGDDGQRGDVAADLGARGRRRRHRGAREDLAGARALHEARHGRAEHEREHETE